MNKILLTLAIALITVGASAQEKESKMKKEARKTKMEMKKDGKRAEKGVKKTKKQAKRKTNEVGDDMKKGN
ncbi:MAG: hypothetical protein SGJ04_09170 [Bacteroidota bacterium]|nr:hypothetical protein [Bacteroidota bacterium]